MNLSSNLVRRIVCISINIFFKLDLKLLKDNVEREHLSRKELETELLEQKRILHKQKLKHTYISCQEDSCKKEAEIGSAIEELEQKACDMQKRGGERTQSITYSKRAIMSSKRAQEYTFQYQKEQQERCTEELQSLGLSSKASRTAIEELTRARDQAIQALADADKFSADKRNASRDAKKLLNQVLLSKFLWVWYMQSICFATCTCIVNKGNFEQSKHPLLCHALLLQDPTFSLLSRGKQC